MTPDYERGNVRLFRNDCLAVLPTLPAGSVDCIVADPPYGIGLDTDYTRFTGGLSPNHHHHHHGIHGDDKPFDPSPWIGFGGCVLWGWPYFAQKLPVGTTLIWDKKSPKQTGTFLSDAEVAWMKGGCGVYIHRQKWHGFDREGEKGIVIHPSQKPIRLMAWCIEKCKGAKSVCDPFMGSGTTGVACVRMGRAFTGIEIDRKYFEIACKRIDKAFDELELFEPVPKAVQGRLWE